MSIGTTLVRSYFNFIYTPVYDFMVARLAPYRRLQQRCVDKFEFKDGDRVLCVGVGTGNEISHILDINRNINIVGVDYSENALKKARKKALAWGKTIDILPMDVQHLEFATGSFDKVLCIHVMDFVEDAGKAAAEAIRVLKERGQFIITYPSDKENMSFGREMLRDSLDNSDHAGKSMRIFSVLSKMLVGGIVYLPLLLRPKRKAYSHSTLELMFSSLVKGDLQIEDYPVYIDFIVHGRK